MSERTISPELEKILANTPWNNLSTGYGQASIFPEYVYKILRSEDEEMPYKEILDIIEHQDTLYQATPSMVKTLIELLKEPQTNKSWLLAILYSVFRAAEFQLESRSPADKKNIKLLDNLYSESANEDKAKENAVDENSYSWHKRSANFIAATYDLIMSFKKSDDKETKEYAENLITLINRYKHTQENIN